MCLFSRYAIETHRSTWVLVAGALSKNSITLRRRVEDFQLGLVVVGAAVAHLILKTGLQVWFIQAFVYDSGSCGATWAETVIFRSNSGL